MASGKPLNVVQREGFFDDSFFKEAWGDFDNAMQRVLDKFDNRGLKVNDGSRSECRDAYSKIRSNKIQDDLYASQALQITEKDGKFQVVMDVKDFNPRELQVRAVDDRIVVEGAYQKISEDGTSKSLKSFYKEFSLPDAADIDQVTTALSKDGVLSIKAPKREGAAITEGPKKSNSGSSSSSMQQSSFNQSDNNSSFRSSSKSSVFKSSSSFDSSSNEGLEGLSKDMRERLMFCDSGFGSTKTSTCSSPAPSETGSESSRVSSTMEFDLNKKAPIRSEVTFNVTSPSQPTPPPIFPQSSMGQQPPPQMYQQPQQPMYQQQNQPSFQQPQPPRYQPPQQPTYQQPMHQQPQKQTMYQQPPQQPMYQQPQQQPMYQQPQQSMPQQSNPNMYQQMPQQQQPQMYQQAQYPMAQPSQQMYQQQQSNVPQAPKQTLIGRGSGTQSNVNITEENGRRVLTSQTSNVVQEKDGIMEHKETAAEISDKNSQAARREASTKMSRQEDDPDGRFKRSEAADAAEVSESCVQQMPDGSMMSVKKNSSSTSSVKQSFSSNAGDMGDFFQTPNFPSGFDDFRNWMDRGHSLMHQMSTDSMASTLSGRSGFTDMSNFSQFSDGSSKFSDITNLSNISNFSDMSSMSHHNQSNMPNMGSMFPENNASRLMKSFSTSSSSSSVNKSFSSGFGNGNF